MNNMLVNWSNKINAPTRNSRESDHTVPNCSNIKHALDVRWVTFIHYENSTVRYRPCFAACSFI